MRRASRCQSTPVPKARAALDEHHCGPVERQAGSMQPPIGHMRHRRQWGRQQCRPHFVFSRGPAAQQAIFAALHLARLYLDKTNHMGYMPSRRFRLTASDGCGRRSALRSSIPRAAAGAPRRKRPRTNACEERPAISGRRNSGYAPMTGGTIASPNRRHFALQGRADQSPVRSAVRPFAIQDQSGKLVCPRHHPRRPPARPRHSGPLTLSLSKGMSGLASG